MEGSRAKLGPDDAVGDELERLEEIVRDIDGTLRSELHQLHQGLAADAGLVTALRDVAATAEAESALQVHVDVDDEPAGLSAVGRTALFRAAQEAVVNIRKHAAARTAWIRLQGDGQSVTLVVSDDGAGLKESPGLGLTTTRERLEALGGTLVVSKRRGGGTELTATLPVEAPML